MQRQMMEKSFKCVELRVNSIGLQGWLCHRGRVMQVYFHQPYPSLKSRSSLRLMQLCEGSDKMMCLS
eukprot:244692-Karenia_brevis.AAC.1